MPKLLFIPVNHSVDVAEGSKILASAVKAKIPIRFGCGACRCGTCAVEVSGDGVLSPMAANEKELLTKIGLPTDGHIRLACQARCVSGEKTIDLDFQDKYSPDTGLD
jgi:ferredoxin